jgi:hypothetical protein
MVSLLARVRQEVLLTRESSFQAMDGPLVIDGAQRE